MNILIIEDNFLWQEKLKFMLEEITISNISLCETIDEAIDNIINKVPDLIIADIILNNENIFELKPTLLKYKIPIIFVTAFPNTEQYEKTAIYQNARFLVKPFHVLSLKSTIHSLKLKLQKLDNLYIIGKYKQKIHLPFSEILWLTAEGNYTIIFTQSLKKHTFKKSISKMAKEFELSDYFLQIQRATYINPKFIDRVELTKGIIHIKGNILKVGQIYRSGLVDYFNSNIVL